MKFHSLTVSFAKLWHNTFLLDYALLLLLCVRFLRLWAVIQCVAGAYT